MICGSVCGVQHWFLTVAADFVHVGFTNAHGVIGMATNGVLFVAQNFGFTLISWPAWRAPPQLRTVAHAALHMRFLRGVLIRAKKNSETEKMDLPFSWATKL